jgi:hypothetical protein
MKTSASRRLQNAAAFISIKVAMVIAALTAAAFMLVQSWYDARHSREIIDEHLPYQPGGPLQNYGPSPR